MSDRCGHNLVSYALECDGAGDGGGGADGAQWHAEVLCQRCLSTNVRQPGLTGHAKHAAAARGTSFCREAATQAAGAERAPCECCRARGGTASHREDTMWGTKSQEKHRVPERMRRNGHDEGTHGTLCKTKPSGPKSNPMIGIAYPQQKAAPHKRAPGPRPPVNGSYRFHVPRIPEREAELEKEDTDHRQRGELLHFPPRPPVGKCPPLPTRASQQQQHDVGPQLFPDGRTQSGAVREEHGPVPQIPHFHRGSAAGTPWGFVSSGGQVAQSDEDALLPGGADVSPLAQSLQRPVSRDSELLTQGPYSLAPSPRFCLRDYPLHRLPYGEMHPAPFSCTTQLSGHKHFPLSPVQPSAVRHHRPTAPWVEHTHPSTPFSRMEPSDDESVGPAPAASFGFQGPCLPTFDSSATSDCAYLMQKHKGVKQVPAGYSMGHTTEPAANDSRHGTDAFLLPPWELQEMPPLCTEADKELSFLCGQEPRSDHLMMHGAFPGNGSGVSGCGVGHQEQHVSLGPGTLGLPKLSWQQIYHAPITTTQNRIELSHQLSKQQLVLSALAWHGKECAERKRPLLPTDEIAAWRCEAAEACSGTQGPVSMFPPCESHEPRIPGIFSLPQVFFGAHVGRGKTAPTSAATSLQPSCASTAGPSAIRAHAGPWGCEGGMPPNDAELDMPAPGERQCQLDAAGLLLQDSLCRAMGMHAAAQNRHTFLNSLNGASLDGLDVFLTCRQCDKNFTDVASLLQHRQACSVPTTVGAALLESMASSLGGNSCRPPMQPTSSTQLPDGGDSRSIRCGAKSSCFSVCNENFPAKADKNEVSANLSELAPEPGHLTHASELDVDDAARLDSLIIETLNGLGYHTDDGELDSSFIEAFADEDTLVSRRAGEPTGEPVSPRPPESAAKAAARDGNAREGCADTALKAATAVGRGRPSRQRGRRGRGKDMRQLYHASRRSKKKQCRGRWASLPAAKRNNYNLAITISAPLTNVSAASALSRQDTTVLSLNSSSNPLRQLRTSSSNTGGGVRNGTFDRNACRKGKLGTEIVKPARLCSRLEKSLLPVYKPIVDSSLKHAELPLQRGVSGRLNKELIHKIVLQKNNFYKVRMKPRRSSFDKLKLDKLKFVFNIPNSVAENQPLSEYDYISDTDTDHESMGPKGIMADPGAVPVTQLVAPCERLNIVANPPTITNLSLGKRRLHPDPVQHTINPEHQKEGDSWLEKEEHNEVGTALGVTPACGEHNSGDCVSSGKAVGSRVQRPQPRMDISLRGPCSTGPQDGAPFLEGAGLQALASPCWRLEDHETWSDAVSCESGNSLDEPMRNWEPSTEHVHFTRPMHQPLLVGSPGGSHSLASAALDVFELGGSASPKLPFPPGSHLGKTTAHFDAADILEALQLSELGERSQCESGDVGGAVRATGVGQDGSADLPDALGMTNAMEKEWSFLGEMSSIFSGNFDLVQDLNSNLVQPLLSHGEKVSLDVEGNFNVQRNVGCAAFHATDKFHSPPPLQGSNIKNEQNTMKNVRDEENLKIPALNDDTCTCIPDTSSSHLCEEWLAEGSGENAQVPEPIMLAPSDVRSKPSSFLSPVLHCDFWTDNFHPFSPCFDGAQSPSPDSRALTTLERYLPCDDGAGSAVPASPPPRSNTPPVVTATAVLTAESPEAEAGQPASQTTKGVGFLPSAPLSILAALCHSDSPARAWNQSSYEDAGPVAGPSSLLKPSHSDGNNSAPGDSGALTAGQATRNVALRLAENFERDVANMQLACDDVKRLSEDVPLNGLPEIRDESAEAAVKYIEEEAKAPSRSAQGESPICSEMESTDSLYFPKDGAAAVGIHPPESRGPTTASASLRDVLYSPISPDSFVFGDTVTCDGGCEASAMTECGGLTNGTSSKENMEPACTSLGLVGDHLSGEPLLDSLTHEYRRQGDWEAELMDRKVKPSDSCEATTAENEKAAGEFRIETAKLLEIQTANSMNQGLLFTRDNDSLDRRKSSVPPTVYAGHAVISFNTGPHSSSSDPGPEEPPQHLQAATDAAGNRRHPCDAAASPRSRRDPGASDGTMGWRPSLATRHAECIACQVDTALPNMPHSPQNESQTVGASESRAMNALGNAFVEHHGKSEPVDLHAEPCHGLATTSAELLVTVVGTHEQELNYASPHLGLGGPRLRVIEDKGVHAVACAPSREAQPAELVNQHESIGKQDGPLCSGSTLLELPALTVGGGGHGGTNESVTQALPGLKTKHVGSHLDWPAVGSAADREDHRLGYEDARTVPSLVVSDTLGKPSTDEVTNVKQIQPEALEEEKSLKKGHHSSAPASNSQITSHPCPHTTNQALRSPSIEVTMGWGPGEAPSMCNACEASFKSHTGLVRHMAIRHNTHMQPYDDSCLKEDAVKGAEPMRVAQECAARKGAVQEDVMHPDPSELTHITDLGWSQQPPVGGMECCSHLHVAQDSTTTTTSSSQQVCNMATPGNRSPPPRPELSTPQHCASLSPYNTAVQNPAQDFVESLFQTNELDPTPTAAAATDESSGNEPDGADNCLGRGVCESVMHSHRPQLPLAGDTTRDVNRCSDEGARSRLSATHESAEVDNQGKLEPPSPFLSTSAARVMHDSNSQDRHGQDEEDVNEEKYTERRDTASLCSSKDEPVLLRSQRGHSPDPPHLYQGPNSLQSSLPLHDTYPSCPNTSPLFSEILDEREDISGCNGDGHPVCISEVAPIELMTKSPMLDLPEDPFIEAIERHLSTVQARADIPRDTLARGVTDGVTDEPHICDLSSTTATYGGQHSPVPDERLPPAFAEERPLFALSLSDASEALVDAHLLAEPLPPGFLEGVLRELADEIKMCSRGRHEPAVRNRDKQYKCRACFQWFLTLGELDFHKLSHIPTPPPTCYMCVQRRFSSREQLREHLREKHRRQGEQHTWRCGMCLKELSDMWMYNEHLREHAVQFSKRGQVHKMALMMATCNDEFGARDSDIDDEQDLNRPPPPVPGALFHHIPELADGPSGEATSVCLSRSPGRAARVTMSGLERGPANEPASSRVPTGGVHPDCKDPSRDCHHCGKQFPKPFKLQRHLVVHSLQRVHMCQLCPVVFLDASDLRAHLGAAHDVDEEEAEVVRHVTIYDCEQCADVMHVIKKSFICSACNYTFSKKEQFDRHMDKHLTAGGAVRAFRRATRPRESLRGSLAPTGDCGPRKRYKPGSDGRKMFGERLEPGGEPGEARENCTGSSWDARTLTLCVPRSYGFHARRAFPSEADDDDDDDYNDDDDDCDDDEDGDAAGDEVLQGRSCFSLPHHHHHQSPSPPLTEEPVSVDEMPGFSEEVFRVIPLPAGSTGCSTSKEAIDNSGDTGSTSYSTGCKTGYSKTYSTSMACTPSSSTPQGISSSNGTDDTNSDTRTGDLSQSANTQDTGSSSTDITYRSTSMESTNNTGASRGTRNNISVCGTISTTSNTETTNGSGGSSGMAGTGNNSKCADTGVGTSSSCEVRHSNSQSTNSLGTSYSNDTGRLQSRHTWGSDSSNSVEGTRSSNSSASATSADDSITNSSISMDITNSGSNACGNSRTLIGATNAGSTSPIGNSTMDTSPGGISAEDNSTGGANTGGTSRVGASAEGASDANILASTSDKSSGLCTVSRSTSTEGLTGGDSTTGATSTGCTTTTTSNNRTGDSITEGTCALGSSIGDARTGGAITEGTSVLGASTITEVTSKLGVSAANTRTEHASHSSSVGGTFTKHFSNSTAIGGKSKGGTIMGGTNTWCSNSSSSYIRKTSLEKPRTQKGPKRPCDGTAPTGGYREAPGKRLKVAARAPKLGNPDQLIPHHGNNSGLSCSGASGDIGGVAGGTGNGRGACIRNAAVSGGGNSGTGGGNVSGGIPGDKVTSAGNASGTFNGLSAEHVNDRSSPAGTGSELEQSRPSVRTLYTAFFSSHPSREVPGPHRKPPLDSLCGRHRTGSPHTPRSRPVLPTSCKSAQSQRDLLNQMFGRRLTTFKIPLRKECKEQLSE